MPLPPPVLLSDDQLELCCNWLKQQTYLYYPVTSDFMNDLYSTGCRPEELLDYSLWTYNSPTDIELAPLKGNNTRTFTASQLSSSLLFAIQNSIKPYNSLTLRQLTSVMKKMILWFKLETANKSAIDYAFRYNVVKKLHNSGMSDSDIQTLFGWVSSLMPASYYGQNIYIVGQIPDMQYIAQITQVSPNNPTATVLINTTSMLISYSYLGTGFYWANVGGTFDPNKLSGGCGSVPAGYKVTVTPLLAIPAFQIETINIVTGLHEDGVLDNTNFSIAVNP